VGLKVELF